MNWNDEKRNKHEDIVDNKSSHWNKE